jgi:aminopeptidase N
MAGSAWRLGVTSWVFRMTTTWLSPWLWRRRAANGFADVSSGRRPRREGAGEDARLVEPLGAWARHVPELGALMKAQLERLAAAESLSKTVRELVGRSLG